MSKTKTVIAHNAGKGFSLPASDEEATVVVVHDKFMRRLIRSNTLPTVKRKRRFAIDGHYRIAEQRAKNTSLIEKLRAVWNAKAKVRADTYNSHEFRRAWALTLAANREEAERNGAR